MGSSYGFQVYNIDYMGVYMGVARNFTNKQTYLVCCHVHYNVTYCLKQTSPNAGSEDDDRLMINLRISTQSTETEFHCREPNIQHSKHESESRLTILLTRWRVTCFLNWVSPCGLVYPGTRCIGLFPLVWGIIRRVGLWLCVKETTVVIWLTRHCGDWQARLPAVCKRHRQKLGCWVCTAEASLFTVRIVQL